jgi:hypothetical protein
MRRLDVSVALVVALIASLVAMGAGDEAPADEKATPTRSVHKDAAVVVESVLDATRAFLAEDPVAARRALDRLAEQSPPLDRERDAAYGSEILSFDQAFHTTIDRSREYASSRRMEDSFNQFVWVQRACITCHGMARTNGFLSPDDPVEEASD